MDALWKNVGKRHIVPEPQTSNHQRHRLFYGCAKMWLWSACRMSVWREQGRFTLVCWQNRRIGENVLPGWDRCSLEGDLEDQKRRRENLSIAEYDRQSMNTHICLEEWEWWSERWTPRQSISCPSQMWPVVWRVGSTGTGRGGHELAGRPLMVI